MQAGPADAFRSGFRALLPFLLPVLLFMEGILLGQSGIPVEDGGEILTVGTLGGSCHPSGMPLVALSSGSACRTAGESGLRVLYAALSALALWALFRHSGLPGILMAVSILALPAFRERLLQWDAYGLLFLAGAILLSSRNVTSSVLGYVAGLSAAVHPQGLFLVLGARPADRSPLRLLGWLLLGSSLYLALPVAAAAGAVVNWGNPGTATMFVRQVMASGYLEFYGGRMGLSGLPMISDHLLMIWRAAWPAVILPAAIGIVDLWRWNRPFLARLGILFSIDALFVVFVNPMAAGTSQTGWMSLLVLAALCASALEILPRKISMLLALAVGFSALPWTDRQVLPDQQRRVGSFLGSTEPDAILFISDNDLLYGGWVEKYCRDLRPDIALLSPDNFSGWFEAMACRYSPGLDLSAGVADVGGVSVGRDSASRALIGLTARDNPGRRVIVR